MRWLICLSLSVALALWTCLIVERRDYAEQYRIAQVDNDPFIKFAHAYHGISSSTRNETTGEQYFYRNGKKCALVTVAVVAAYARRGR